MRRTLLTMLTVLSLLACVITTALWVRGVYATDSAVLGGNSRAVLVEGRRGGVRVVYVRRDKRSEWNGRDPAADDARDLPHTPLLHDRGFRYRRSDPMPVGLLWDDTRPVRTLFGFSYGYVPSTAGGTLASEWTVPYFAMAILFAIAPARRARARLKEMKAARRSADRLCVRCGYDIRATPQRCPECGTELAATELAT